MKKRQRQLFGLLGILVAILSLIYVARPSGHIPPYDANLIRLAESQRQGYCAGKAFWASEGVGNASTASACRAHSKKSNKPDMIRVQAAFCRAITDSGYADGVKRCLDIMDSQQYWPTYDGAITNAWNRARPYPNPGLPTSSPSRDQSRTGGRSGNTSHRGNFRP